MTRAQVWSLLQPQIDEYLDAQRAAESMAAKCVVVADKDMRLLLKALRAQESKVPPSAAQPKISEVVTAKAFRDRYEALLKLGGTLRGVFVAFGRDDPDLHMSFKPKTDGQMCVELAQSAAYPDKLKAELNRANRGLWDKKRARPGCEYRAIEYAVEIELRLREIQQKLQATPRISRKALEALQPEVPSILEMRSALLELIECCRQAKDKRFAVRLGKAFELFDRFNDAQRDRNSFFDSPTESDETRNLKNCALDLALRFQRPPTQKELREAIGWTRIPYRKAKAPWKLSEFKTLLANAGLTWLPTHWKAKAMGVI